MTEQEQPSDDRVDDHILDELLERCERLERRFAKILGEPLNERIESLDSKRGP